MSLVALITVSILSNLQSVYGKIKCDNEKY